MNSAQGYHGQPLRHGIQDAILISCRNIARHCRERSVLHTVLVKIRMTKLGVSIARRSPLSQQAALATSGSTCLRRDCYIASSDHPLPGKALSRVLPATYWNT